MDNRATARNQGSCCRRALAVLAYLALASSAGAQSPSSTFETNMSPGEGPHDFVTVGSQLQLRELPNITSRATVMVQVRVGQHVDYDEIRYRTTRAGRIVVLVPAQVAGRMIGPVRRLMAEDYASTRFTGVNIGVKPGLEIEYLQYRAEATCFVRIGKDVIDASPCPDLDKSAFKLESEPSTELWLHLSLDKSKGWLLVTPATVAETPQ